MGRNLGETKIEIDKMGGLIASTESNRELTLCPWDNVPSSVNGILIGDQKTLWEGEIFSPSEIEAIFQPYQKGTQIPTQYRLRPGNLGMKRKVRGFLRILSEDGKKISFIKTNAGGVLLNNYGSFRIPQTVTLQLSVSNRTKDILLYKNGMHRNRLSRL